MTDTKTSYATCPLCEATCGLEIGTRGREVLSIRGDEQDIFSHGYICPKAYSLKELDADRDCIREPIVRRGDQWLKVSWDDAFAEVERGLMPILQERGRDALAVYVGNPNAHNLASLLYLPVLLHAAKTHNFFSASTVDQMPKQVTAGLMFGTMLSIPVPDLERTEFLLLLGANPLVSNGSLMTAPDMRGRLRSLRQRGGKIVVIDPVRTRTAQEADEHHFIRPGHDAHFLFAMVHTLFAENLVAPGRLAEHLNSLEQVREMAQSFAPERVAEACGIEPETIRALARELAAAPRAAVYGRIGTCTQEFGTLASWLVDVLNVLTGNLDREGGAMFPRAAAGARNASGTPGKGRGVRFGRWKSRVRGLPEVYGELPASCLAEEIETPGEGQVRALITLAGNPALSTPNSQRLQQSLGALEFMVSVDMYLNETTRFANVILPPPPSLARSHYDLALYNLTLSEEIPGFNGAAHIETWNADPAWQGVRRTAEQLTAVSDWCEAIFAANIVFEPLAGELFPALKPRRGPERMLDFMLRSGPYGDGFGAKEGGLSLAVLEDHPHGVDLGPLQPRIPEVLRTISGKIELAPAPIVEDVARLRASLDRANGHMLLIGRRDLRSNNSWMHNLHVLAKGKDRCTLLVHPDDAARLALVNGDRACVTSQAGTVEIPVEVTDTIMPGVVSIPHGWGHALPGTQMRVASEHAGVNTNILTVEENVEPLSGNAILNGIAVTVERAKV